MQGESGIRIPDAVKDAPRSAVPALVSGFDVRVADWRLLSAVNMCRVDRCFHCSVTFFERVRAGSAWCF